MLARAKNVLLAGVLLVLDYLFLDCAEIRMA